MGCFDKYRTLRLICSNEGLKITSTPLTGQWSYYRRKSGLIVLNSSLTMRQKTAALAHEYHHFLHGHDGHQGKAVEDQINKTAAVFLINPHDYAKAERLVGPAPGALAEELDTDIYLIHCYQQYLATHSFTLTGSVISI